MQAFTIGVYRQRYGPREQDHWAEVEGLECDKEKIKEEGRGIVKYQAGI